MSKALLKGGSIAYFFVSCIQVFVPDTILKQIPLFQCVENDDCKVLIIRLLLYFVVLTVATGIIIIYLKKRTKIVIRGKNYTVEVRYGDIFSINNCKKLSAFDECYTTKVGHAPQDINPSSICGKYLLNHSIDINNLIQENGIRKARGKSRYNHQDKYESGTLIPCDDFLLLAFAKLDEDGKGYITRNEYLDCLSLMWKEIDKYYAQTDICIPILGSGTTRTGDGNPLTQQELLDIIIGSYKICGSKIKHPNKLIIICQKSDEFSLNKITA